MFANGGVRQCAALRPPRIRQRRRRLTIPPSDAFYRARHPAHYSSIEIYISRVRSIGHLPYSTSEFPVPLILVNRREINRGKRRVVSMMPGVRIKIDAGTREGEKRRVIYSGFRVRRTKNARRSTGQVTDVPASTHEYVLRKRTRYVVSAFSRNVHANDPHESHR